MGVTFFVVLHDLKMTDAHCPAKCEQIRGRFDETGMSNRALVEHSFENFTVENMFQCLVRCLEEKCNCQAYQMKGNRCELLDEDRFTGPDDLVEEEGYTYFDMIMEYAKSTDNTCANQPCSNNCCAQNRCFNGGTCTELCDHPKRKFNCTCAKEYSGKYCEKRIPTACNQLQLESKKPVQSAVYTLLNSTDKSLYQTFCDFTSEKGFVWTLVESFSLANKNDFKLKQFYKDYPVNQNSFSWDKFRLSKAIMSSALAHSTHVRATCNFNIDGLKTTDYLRARMIDANVLLLNGEACKKFEYVNIRGYDCHNCTVWFTQTESWHAHVDSYYTPNLPCQFTEARNGSVPIPAGEDNFGFYETVNPLHRCSSTNKSTTQWWFGVQ